MKKKRINIDFTLIIFCLILGFSVLFFKYGYDSYWHIGIGKYIFNTKTIPYTDIFSWFGTINNLHWISHEWLFEVSIYMYQSLFGNIGLLLYALINILLISITLYNFNKDTFKNNIVHTILWLAIGLLFFIPFIVPRPHLISFLLFSITILLSKKLIENENSKLIYIIPIITILWANFHGGSSNLGYIIYLLIIICNFLPIKSNIKLTKKQLHKFIYAFISSVLFIIINPHGITMLIYPYKNIFYTKMVNCISEWKPIPLISLNGITFYIFISIIIIYILKSIRKKSLFHCILLITFIILGTKSIKFIPYTYILATAIIPNYWKISKIKINEKIISIFLLLCFIVLFIPSYKEKNFKLVDDKIINYLKNKDLKLYNSYNLGGYLIYNNIKPFIDGRADMYIDTIFSDVCDIEKNKDIKLINKYNFDTFLIENNSELYKYLNKNNKYKLIIKNTNHSLFKLKEDN